MLHAHQKEKAFSVPSSPTSVAESLTYLSYNALHHVLMQRAM